MQFEYKAPRWSVLATKVDPTPINPLELTSILKKYGGERQHSKVITKKQLDTSKGEAPYKTMDAVAQGEK